MSSAAAAMQSDSASMWWRSPRHPRCEIPGMVVGGALKAPPVTVTRAAAVESGAATVMAGVSALLVVATAGGVVLVVSSMVVAMVVETVVEVDVVVAAAANATVVRVLVLGVKPARVVEASFDANADTATFCTFTATVVVLIGGRYLEPTGAQGTGAVMRAM